MGNAGECVALLDQVFATRPRAEWLERLAAGGDFIVSIVNSVDQLPDDPQVKANGYVTTFEHPGFGPTRVVGVPVRLSETPGTVRMRLLRCGLCSAFKRARRGNAAARPRPRPARPPGSDGRRERRPV